MVSIRQAVAASLRSARTVSGTAGMLSLLTAALVVAPHAYAQQAPATQSAAATSEQPENLQEVTVTGSRIKRTSDFTTATPTTVFDAAEIANRGIVNIGDVLSETPSNISNVTPTSTGNSSFNAGAYIADLRGLNPFFGSRTLTLIDGQRAVSTNTLDSFDLNFIPQVLVQRIDTVTGGGSAVYGSGAVGGVVNIILDHQLEGGKFNADTYDTHRQLVQHRPVADKIVGSKNGKGGDRVHERHKTGLRQACRNSYHILFGHAAVEVAPREFFDKRLKSQIPDITA